MPAGTFGSWPRADAGWTAGPKGLSMTTQIADLTTRLR